MAKIYIEICIINSVKNLVRFSDQKENKMIYLVKFTFKWNFIVHASHLKP